MRKYLSIICGVLLVGILAISFTSCTKEDKVAPKIKTLKFDVKVNNGTPLEETKAVKTGWVVGDKMYAFFNVSTGATTGHLNAIKYVTLTYNGTGWDGELSGELTDANEIGTAGTMYTVYFPFGGVSIASDGASGVTFKTAGNTNESLNGQPIYTYYMTDNTEYTVSTVGDVGTLHANFTVEIPDNYVYFFVNKDGDNYNSNEKYRLSAQGIIPTACIGFSAGTFSESALDAGRCLWGYAFNDAGIAFSGKIDASWASATDHIFNLYSEEEATKSKTFNKALSSHKSVNLNMASGWTKCGFRGYTVSPGILKRNGDGTYELTSGSNPFEMHNYYNKSESLNKYYFSWSFLKSDDELGASGNNINPNSAKLPSGWTFPSGGSTSSIWYSIFYNRPSVAIKIEKPNGSIETIPSSWDGQDKTYAFVVITKESKEYYGILLLRDGAFIPKGANIQYWGNGSAVNTISYDQYSMLKEFGCVFLSSTGRYSTTFSDWRYIQNDSNVEVNYWSNTYKDATTAYAAGGKVRGQASGSSYTSGGATKLYYPVRLVKPI